jgi:serine phosphatase RsbU (regulator of sigma subunit)
MTAHDSDIGRMLCGLLRTSHLTRSEQIPARVAEHAAEAGMPEVLIYLCDLQESVLRLLTGSGLDAGEDSGPAETQLKIDGTLAGRAFQLGRILPVPANGQSGVQWWVPVVNGTERLGVLRVTTAPDRGCAPEELECLAALVALLVASKSNHSDSLNRLVRTQPMNVAAEMQWQLMPPRTYADDRVVISAVLEPAYHVGGDAFDYSIAADVVHLAVFDAMGHDTAAGLTANLAVSACRNHRRQGLGLVPTGDAIEKVLIEQFAGRRYATAVLADLDTSTGILSWINRGHHPPVVIRGGRWTTTLPCPPAHPLGTGLGMKATVCREQLEPGDRLVLYTDGITEARNPAGQEFGLDRFLDFLIRHHADALPVPETLRRLIQHILKYHNGYLNDDATVLLLQWHGPTPYAPGEAEALTGIGRR